MRSMLVAPLVVTALASCASKNPPPPPAGQDLTIDVALALDNGKCVVRFKDADLKKADRAVAWTGHSLIWHVVGNDCGDKKKIGKKALGLKYMKLKSTGEPAPWFKNCKSLDHVPPGGGGDVSCVIPSSKTEGWQWTDDVLIYEYVIDGDEVDPGDPDVGIRRNG
jgi:hypothetical protein